MYQALFQTLEMEQRTDRQTKDSALMELVFTRTNGNCYYYFEVFMMFWESIEIDNMVLAPQGDEKLVGDKTHARGI